MTRPDALPAQVRGYLDEVHRHLADLDPDDRTDLTAPVAQRLVELTGRDGDPADIERQFGTPEQLALELRRSAGYPPPAAASTGGWWLAAWTREAARRPLVAAALGYVVSLRPAWWAVRGYLVLGGVLGALGPEKFGLHTIGYYNQVFDHSTTPHSVLWVALPLAAILASIVLGLRTSALPPSARWLIVALDVAAVITLLAFPTWWLPPAGASVAGLAG
jgi:hypothetical protein